MSHQTAVDQSFEPLLAEEIDDRKWTWKSRPGYKPIFFIIAALAFTFTVIMPPTQGMLNMVTTENPPGYKLPPGAKTITDTVNKKLRPEAFNAEPSKRAKASEEGSHNKIKPLLTAYQVAQMAKLTVCILFLAAFLWGTEALPLGATDIMVGVML